MSQENHSEQVDAPVDPEPTAVVPPLPQIQTTGETAGMQPPARSPWGKRVVAVLVLGAIFAALGHFAGPPRTSKAAQDAMNSLQRQLKDLTDARANLSAELKAAKDELARLTQDARSASSDAQQERTQRQAHEQQLAALTNKLQDAQAQVEPLKKQLDSVRQTAQEAAQQAAVNQQKAAALEGELASVKKTAEDLQQQRTALTQAKDNLEKAATASKARIKDLRRLLAVLELGEGGLTVAKAEWPGEMPLTIKELTYAFGSPSMSFDKQRNVELRWGKEHWAKATDGVVHLFDGQQCTRQALGKAGASLPRLAPAPAPWRLEEGQPVRYADLVEIFGKPQQVSGTAAKFTATWIIGAWARNASAIVAEGLVTQFDGRPISAAELCELVRQRAQAYRNPEELEAYAARMAELYQQARSMLSQELAREAAVVRRDGLTLKDWTMGPVDSAATWMGLTDVVGEAVTVRTTLDCTYAGADGKTTTTHRYAIVTLSAPAGQMQQAECAILDGRK